MVQHSQYGIYQKSSHSSCNVLAGEASHVVLCGVLLAHGTNCNDFSKCTKCSRINICCFSKTVVIAILPFGELYYRCPVQFKALQVWPAPTGPSADRYPLLEQAHRPGFLPRHLHVPAHDSARVILDDELVGHGLQADEVVVLADDDLATPVKLRTDLRQDGLLVLLEREDAFDGGVR